MNSSYQKTSKTLDYKFTFPGRQIFLMILTIIGTVIICFLLFPSVKPVFLSNPFINGVILSVFAFGVIACFGQILQLVISIRWIIAFTEEQMGHNQVKAPRLLTTMERLLRKRSDQHHLTQSSAQSILESVATRIDETRDISRYIVNLLIFLGLLGTFFGLATTIPAVVDTIKSLTPSEDENGIAIFGRLIDGLETQLGGMGTAFASSLLGLAGSLTVGLLELFARHGQNRFYRELEDWLSLIMHPGYASTTVKASSRRDNSDISNSEASMFERLDNLSWVIEEFGKTQQRTEQHIEQLAQALAKQAGYHSAITELAKNQIEVLENIRETFSLLSSTNDSDPMGRISLQNIEKQTARLIEELYAGFDELTQTLNHYLAQNDKQMPHIKTNENRKK